MTDAPARVELEQSTGNLLGLPILIAVVLVAIVISQFAYGSASVTVLAVCGVVAVLDVLLAAWCRRNLGVTLVITPDEIVFNRRPGSSRKHFSPSTITRTDTSTLSFRTARNGPLGSQGTGYVLKLHDNATGQEVYAGAFGGRQRVRQACESQGWVFG